MKIWIDTDIGSEIDDALALAYLVTNPVVEIVGISTVTDGPRTRAMLASAICRAAGRAEIPIYVGSDKAMNGESFGQGVAQAAALRLLDHQIEFENCDVSSRLRATIDNLCGEVVLLTIGPLSNVAGLFAVDPEISARLRLITMCGNFSTSAPAAKPRVEWNTKLDPESADQVFRTPITGGHYLLGLETTYGFSIPSSTLEKQAESRVLQAVLKLHRAKGGEEKPLAAYDLAAAVLAVRPELGQTQRGTAGMDPEGDRGATTWSPDQTGNHQRYETIFRDKIMHEFFSVLRLRIHQEFRE